MSIGDLGRVITGNTPPSKEDGLFGPGYPFLTPSDMDAVRRVETSRSVTEAWKNRNSRRMLPDGATAVVCIGATIGKVAQVRGPTFSNQQVNSIVPDPAVAHPDFVYYLMTTMSEEFKAAASGAATPLLNKTAFSSLQVTIPHVASQRRIASILSAYDDLIENNQRRIKLLEDMAQLLYREWFVHYRFPGHEDVELVDSELGPIPAGWEVKPTADCFDVLGGATPSKKKAEYWDGGHIQWFTPSDLTKATAMFMEDSGDHITDAGLAGCSAKLFPPGSVMMTSRATIGIVSINTTEACTNQGFITCLPNEGFGPYFIFYWLKANVETFIAHASGATFKEISKRTFKALPMVVPPSAVQAAFERQAAPLADMIRNLLRQNGSLRANRDLLLPRLISGELDVSDWGEDD